MADFEGLINQALAKQDSNDPNIRERVYQSSRNALVKMLEKTGIVDDNAVRHHFEKLELSIQKIEAGFQPVPQPVVEEPAPPPAPVVEPVVSPEPVTSVEQVASVPPAPVSPQSPAPPPAALPPQAPQPKPAEPDIIDELEALLHPTYKPEPMFPPVEPSRPNPSILGQSTVTPAPAEAVVQQPAQTPITAPQQPAIQSPAPEPAVAPPAPAASVQSAKGTEPTFEDDFTIPEKVDAYLGEARAEETISDHIDEVETREQVHVYKRKNPLLRRIWPIFLALAVVLVILWILYALLANIPQDDSAQNSGISVGPVGESQVGEDGSIFITLLEPTDLSALVTAGRGSAELITQQNQQVLRLQSVRQGALTASGAEPILLELEKGVLNHISGKAVTVELYAKSGQNGPAQFAVECDFAGDSICGRKRFRVGTQPERIVFALDLTRGIREGQRAYLAINTDITNSADSSGNGDAIDVIYVRLRLPAE